MTGFEARALEVARVPRWPEELARLVVDAPAGTIVLEGAARLSARWPALVARGLLARLPDGRLVAAERAPVRPGLPLEELPGLPVAELARRCGVCRRTVRRWAAAGRAPAWAVERAGASWPVVTAVPAWSIQS